MYYVLCMYVFCLTSTPYPSAGTLYVFIIFLYYNVYIYIKFHLSIS